MALAESRKGSSAAPPACYDHHDISPLEQTIGNVAGPPDCDNKSQAASMPFLSLGEHSIPASAPLDPRAATSRDSCSEYLAQFFTIILPLALVVGVITADLFNLEFVHLAQAGIQVPLDQWTLPSDDVLNADKLRWTFLQSAYLLPLMLFAGPVFILIFVLLVGRLRSNRLLDGLSLVTVLATLVVGLMTLLTAVVGTSVVGVIFTRIVAGVAVCSTLGLVTQAVELLAPPPPIPSACCQPTPATTGFSTILFSIVYGLGTAIASSSVFAGYQLARVLQRSGISFVGDGPEPSQGFRALFVLEGLFIVGLTPIVAVLLHLACRRRRRQDPIESDCIVLPSPDSEVPETWSEQTGYGLAKISAASPDDADDRDERQDGIRQLSSASFQGPTQSISKQAPIHGGNQDLGDSIVAEEGDDKKGPTWFASLRRFSTPLSSVAILTRGVGGASAGSFNMRSLSKVHTGFGLWVSAVLRRIMVFAYGGLGVHEAAFDLISAGTSSRETFICGVLIVSNTVIIQLAVVSLIAPLKASGLQQSTDPVALDTQLDPALKHVPALPGLPALVGGVCGGVSAVVWSMLATQPASPCSGGGRGAMVRRWKTRRWWVPALLTACVAISVIGLGLGVVASVMVPTGECGSWVIYAATAVTCVGSTPQLPLALLQIYTVMDAELEANGAAAGAASATVRRVRWERVGVMISTLTTIAGSELLTAWVFLMPDAAQKAFLFTSVALAVGGSIWLMLRHTRGSIARRGNTTQSS